MTVNIYITIDTEFSIGGTFQDPINKKPISLPSIYCENGGVSHGLGFILETLASNNLDATFFLEALNTNYFGDEPLKNVVEYILKNNQDIQLHIHPCWLTFRDNNWAANVCETPPIDTLVGATLSESVEIIKMGIDTLKRVGCKEPVALRMGNLFVGQNVYQAMNVLGLKISSNIGLGISKPEESNLQYYGGKHRISNVLEIPVTTYHDIKIGPFQKQKCITIIGTSFYEMKSILNKAYNDGIKSIVILTHPSEYVVSRDGRYEDIIPNNLVQGRLKKLCEYLDKNKDKYKTVKISSAVNSLYEEEPDCFIRAPIAGIVVRYIENIIWNK